MSLASGRFISKFPEKKFKANFKVYIFLIFFRVINLGWEFFSTVYYILSSCFFEE